VWKLIRPLDFSYLPSVSSVTTESKENVGSVKKVHYKDGTVQTIEIRGLSDLSHSISWDLITSNPPTSVSSASYSIKLYRVTASNETFVVWKTDYSSDGSIEVIQDQKYKQHENFQALRDTLQPRLDIKITERQPEPKEQPKPDLKVSIQSPAKDTPKEPTSKEPETEEEKKRKLQESEKQREIHRKQKEENEKLIGAVNLKKQDEIQTRQRADSFRNAMQKERDKLEKEMKDAQNIIDNERKALTERKAKEEAERKSATTSTRGRSGSSAEQPPISPRAGSNPPGTPTSRTTTPAAAPTTPTSRGLLSSLFPSK